MFIPIVTVPARNEEERLPALIAALAAQTVLGTMPVLRAVIVLNNSTDGSAKVLEALAPRYPQLEMTVLDVTYGLADAHVGTARRQALEHARALLGTGAGGVLLTTDGDAVPLPDWIERNLAALAGGADLVGGRIIGDPDEEAALGPGFQRRAELIARYARLKDHLTALIDPILHDPWPRHQDHTGASLAVRAEVYDAVGGLPALPFREDLGFVDRVVAAGYRLVHPEDVRVVVSARLKGRAPGGMADCIAGWVEEDRSNLPILVEAPAAIAERAARRRRIRALAGKPRSDWHGTLLALGLPAEDLAGVDGAKDVSALIHSLVPDEPDAVADTPIGEALDAITLRIAALEDAEYAA